MRSTLPSVPYCGKQNLAETRWEKIAIPSGATKLMDEIERQLRENELVIERWAPIHLKNELENWFWKNGVSLQKALDVWQATCRYLYLPRLSNKGVFTQTLSDATGSRDFFALAQGEEGGKFLGFIFGKPHLVLLDSSTLLISSERAVAYEAEQASISNGDKGPQPNPGASGGGEPRPTPGKTGEATSREKVVRRFIGNVSIDPMMGKVDTQSIFDEVIQHLDEYSGSTVTITLEIQAETDNPKGFDTALQRTVRENSRQLKFTIAEFE